MTIGTVGEIKRFPIKSMLGENLETCEIFASGLRGDRGHALLDPSTGRIASAKQPNLWRELLTFSARTASQDDPRSIVVSDLLGNTVNVSDPEFDIRLSELLQKAVRLIDVRPPGIELNRARPDEVMIEGVDAAVTQDVLAIAAAAPSGGFFDFAPIHLMTTASLDAIGTAAPATSICVDRYRPNIVIETAQLPRAFAENDWIGRKLRVGPYVSLEVIAPTPRCAVPMLAHGALPQSREAVSVVNTLNRIEFPLLGPGTFPCLGAYATVLVSGPVKRGDTVVLQ